jgi:co-chaperonin GroES (HSP10)
MAKARSKKGAKKKDIDLEIEVDDAPKRFARHVQPLGPRVLVRIQKGADRLDSGLFLPKGAKDEHAEALFCEVLEVARTMPNMPGVDDSNDGDPTIRPDLGANVSGIPVGAKVLIAKQHGIAIPWDETLRLVEVRRVLAIVEEIARDELQ